MRAHGLILLHFCYVLLFISLSNETLSKSKKKKDTCTKDSCKDTELVGVFNPYCNFEKMKYKKQTLKSGALVSNILLESSHLLLILLSDNSLFSCKNGV